MQGVRAEATTHAVEAPVLFPGIQRRLLLCNLRCCILEHGWQRFVIPRMRPAQQQYSQWVKTQHPLTGENDMSIVLYTDRRRADHSMSLHRVEPVDFFDPACS